MSHPMVDQLRFTRSEFLRGLRGLGEEDAQRRIEPMNCISWNVGHLAWQEQQYFVTWPSGERPFPDIDREFVSGGPKHAGPGPGVDGLAVDHRGCRPVARHADER